MIINKRKGRNIVFRLFVGSNNNFLALSGGAVTFSVSSVAFVVAEFSVAAGFCSFNGADNNSSVGFASNGFGSCAGNGLNGGMNDSAFIGVHGFKSDGTSGFYCVCRGFSCISAKHSEAMTAFGVAKKEFNTRLIPESYLLLREMPSFPFGTDFRTPEKITSTISPRTPVLTIENDYILTAGANLLQALDRLEVAEYSARSAITASKLGDLKLMGEDAIQDIITAFNLIP